MEKSFGKNVQGALDLEEERWFFMSLYKESYQKQIAGT